MLEKIYKSGFDKMKRTETCGYLLAISTAKHTNIMREKPPYLFTISKGVREKREKLKTHCFQGIESNTKP